MRNLFILYTFAPALSRATGARDVIFRERHAFFRFHRPSKTAFRSHRTKMNLCHAPFGVQNSISQTVDTELGKYKPKHRPNVFRHVEIHLADDRHEAWEVGKRHQTPFGTREAFSQMTDAKLGKYRSTIKRLRHAGSRMLRFYSRMTRNDPRVVTSFAPDFSHSAQSSAKPSGTRSPGTSIGTPGGYAHA